MAGLLNLFRKMEKNRRLYIGNDCILAMHHIASGYGECLRDFGILQDEEFDRFIRFVHDALNVEMGGVSIWRLIAEKTHTDDEAFDLFFSLLNKFDEQQTALSSPPPCCGETISE